MVVSDVSFRARLGGVSKKIDELSDKRWCSVLNSYLSVFDSLAKREGARGDCTFDASSHDGLVRDTF